MGAAEEEEDEAAARVLAAVVEGVEYEVIVTIMGPELPATEEAGSVMMEV